VTLGAAGAGGGAVAQATQKMTQTQVAAAHRII
jgi:hypothetical protein